MNNNVRVTDIDAEYLVNLVKYHFEEFIVFEYKIQNNMENIVINQFIVRFFKMCLLKWKLVQRTLR